VPVEVGVKSEGGVGYTALHPELKGCVAVGDTPAEALANLEEARKLWLETAYEHGDKIPLPRESAEQRR
jgi:predicted RNase H-like HicB family nuclease